MHTYTFTYVHLSVLSDSPMDANVYPEKYILIKK